MFFWSRSVLSVALLSIAAPAFAQFDTKAPHAVILDANTGIVLFEKKARDPMPPSSMTKIMTADIIFDALSKGELTMETEFTVSEDAWRRGGAASGSSTMYLELGSTVSVKDLLSGIIIQSGNDACIVMAEGMSGSEDAFAARMTDRAHELGLKSATFRNATGWPHPEHEISALDLAKLADQHIEKYPEYFPLYNERNFTWNNIKQGNRNPLLGKVTGADGLKTGSTEAAGYGLVGTAKRGEDRRIIVINGLESSGARRDAATKLMEASFSQFRIYPLFAKDERVGEIDVYMGKATKVPFAIDQKIETGLHVTERKNVTSRVEYKVVPAPVAVGDIVAELIIEAPGREAMRYPLRATEDVKRKGLFARAWSSLLQKIRG